jgi:histone H3/H4
MARTKQAALLKALKKKQTANADSKATAGGGDAAEKATRKKIKFKWGTTALREIKKHQRNVDNIVPRAAMRRLISEIAQQEMPNTPDSNGVAPATRFSPEAIEAIRTSAESVMIEHLERAYKYTLNRKKETLASRDMRAAAGDMLKEWARLRS